MCSRAQQCQVLDFERLRLIALRTCAKWERQPLVARMDVPNAYGRTVGNVVSFARFAPYCTVPHELAHFLAKSLDHGAAWRDAYDFVARLLDEANTEQALAEVRYTKALLDAEPERYR